MREDSETFYTEKFKEYVKSEILYTSYKIEKFKEYVKEEYGLVLRYGFTYNDICKIYKKFIQRNEISLIIGSGYHNLLTQGRVIDPTEELFELDLALEAFYENCGNTFGR